MSYLLGCFQDFGVSFRSRYPHRWLRDGDEFYHCSRHRLDYTLGHTGLHLGTARDGAGQHTRLLEDRYMRGPVPAGDDICP
ncbi:hypothetical protein E2562_003320 [Oryza meyeriana var. granulata]|uniref:Uncharacterized protein n=1 Tax=Oryza meyeriana var. granulata TaxID=110450 RepID=A0A6G1EET4_9ORYZ|nr:hypothetical protein E2562_003320 [Oryza meyeriana var. granulata]